MKIICCLQQSQAFNKPIQSNDWAEMIGWPTYFPTHTPAYLHTLPLHLIGENGIQAQIYFSVAVTINLKRERPLYLPSK